MVSARCPIALLIYVLAGPVWAQTGREALYDTWGTSAQCAGKPIIPGGSKLAEPYDIAEGWLRQGDLWCLLMWFDAPVVDARQVFFAARAICGEDSVQTYGLGLHLSEGAVTLIWDEAIVIGPLMRCATAD